MLRWSDEAGGLDDRELEAFMEGRAVLEVAEHFFIHDKQPTLVLTLSYRDEAPDDGRRGKGGSTRPAGHAGPHGDAPAGHFFRHPAVLSIGGTRRSTL